MQSDHEVDAVGLLCPLPVLKTKKRIASLESGQVLKVIADDPAAIIDIPHFCSEHGHELVSSTNDTTTQIYFIRKA